MPMTDKNKEKPKRNQFKCFEKQKSNAKPLPLLEQIMKTYLTDELMDTFNIKEKKRKYLKKLLAEQTKETGNEESKKTILLEGQQIPAINMAHRIMRQNAERCPTTHMSRFLEQDVRNMIKGKHLEKKYPKIVDSMIIEIREIFITMTHEAGVNLKIKASGGNITRFQPEPYKYMGKTNRYQVFLRHRDELKSKWVLFYPLIKRIHQECIDRLTEKIIEVGVFHYTEVFHLSDLSHKFSEQAASASRTLNLLRDKIISLIETDKTRVKLVHMKHYYEAITTLQTIHVSNCITRLLEHIIEVSGSERRVPFLMLTIKFQDGLVLKPSPPETSFIYQEFMKELISIGKKYQTVEKRKRLLIEKKIHLNVTTDYFEDAVARMTANIQSLYESVLKYVEYLDSLFCEIYQAINRTSIEDSKNFTFENGCALLQHYEDYLKKATNMECNENFPIGQLVLSEYIRTMRLSLTMVIEEIFLELCNLHQVENEKVCEVFVEVARIALKKPVTTEELIEQGKYMIKVKTVILAELRQRIQTLLNGLTTIIDYGNLTSSHMALNARTIRWLQEIEAVLEQNSAMYEGMKYEAEEKVHNSIGTIKKKISSLIPKLHIFNQMDDLIMARQYVLQLAPIMEDIKEIKQQIEWTNREEGCLGFALSQYPEYTTLITFVHTFYHLVKMCLNLVRKITVWLDGQFEFLSFEETEMYIEDINKEFLKTFKMYKNKIRQANQENSPLKFKGIVDDTDSNNWPAPMKLCGQALQQIKDFRPAMTMMRIMCNDALLKRHWKDMSEIAKFDLTPNAGTSLRKMMNMGLEGDIDQFDVISNGATKERELLNNLTKMKAEWQEITFKVGQYKETKLPILTALDDVQVILDDHIIKALTMRGSVFVKPYEAEVKEFYAKLVRVNSTIEEWGKVQSQWLYLLPIFSSKDIVAQMPDEGVLFREVNDTFRKYMEAVVVEPRVMETAGSLGVLEAMVHCLELLEQINDGVTNYLERKRLFFPRFFFLSNDEMLEILSETKDPLRVQPHLKKCFEAINSLEFDSTLAIHEMISMEGERVKFKNIVNTKEAGGSVEKWLILVEEQMVVSIREQIIRSNRHYAMVPRIQWVTKWQGQIVLCVSQMHWTANVHKSLNRHEGFTIPKFAESQAEQLKDTVALIRDPKLSNLNRITIKALIVIDVHAKDVVEDLLHKGVNSDKEFKWLSQLRYYLEEDEALVRLINATVKYAYEYLGNSDRLVITPLTDRCYRTLIGAYHLHLNGAPEGPAGTGKTETTKDLAKALAVQCVVFNCSDGLDYKAMGKFFKGLASCGAWVCFDEFNRIDIEVLSVVAQQILSIILAVRGKVKTFLFEGTELKLNPTCYVCITMNPGYAGRTELPDNLKVLFRTVAMMVPDYAMIGEISLYSFGFIDARNLSVKIVTTYRLCSEQLSSQNHYDYGMRAVKSVLSAAGNNKAASPNENESILLLRAILDVNLPKFLSHDLPLFSGIISDLFPGITLPQADYKVFTKTMVERCKERNLQPKQTFIVKVIQTYEMMIVRHGFMIVGLPFAGKTSTLKVLADTLTVLNERGSTKEKKVQYKFLNPKSITMGQLYGEFDPISYEWFDGVVSNTFRDFTVSLEPDRKWIIFDGPVDAVWIENMNSALDDNKKLCLMSGEVMSMTSSMSLIFEVMDLEQASPATVSRCGMIYMEPISLGWRPFLDSWLPHQNPEWCTTDTEKLIINVFEWFIPPCLTFIRKKCVLYCNPGDICLVKNTISLLQMYLDDACEKSARKEEDFKFLRNWVEASILMSITWGLAGILDADSRQKFDEFLKKMFSNQNSQYPIPESIGSIEVIIPQDNLLTEYAFIYKNKGTWEYYTETVKYKRVEEATNLQQVLIPTVDTSRYMSLLTLHIQHKQPFLLVGPTGTGKSFYVQDLILNKIDKDLYEPGFITFTVQITCNQTQNMIISKLNKRRRGIYGPPKGKLAVLFIDDVNMPQKEVYGAQPPIELLRQFFDHKNWFDLKNTEPIYMHDIMFCAAMGLVGGSRQEVYARFLRHFSIISINEFSEDSMAKIYVNILHLGWKNNGFPSDSIVTVNQIVNASLEIYKNATEFLRPTPSKSHYVFNLRDFSRLILGCAMLRRESVTEEIGKKIYARLWVHEVLRIFFDRLIEQQDKDWLFERIKIIVRDFFRDTFENTFDNLPRSATNEITQESLKSLMFGTYFDQDSTEDDRRYEQASNMQAFIDMAQTFLDDYNASHKNKMDVVLFDYALEHLSKICRILSMASGSGLLVGISGSGRQSLTRLASEIYQIKLFQPEITKNYAINEWRDDIKKVLKEAGGAGRNCVFLISEGQIKEEFFLQDIDCLLNSGEVPNIYQIDEKQEILDMVRLAAQGGNRNLDISPLTIFFYFTKRCKEKLHILLCFSPVGSTFRNRLRLFPSLINCCTIDWFDEWPETALQEVARTWMSEINLTDEVKNYCVVACQYFHVQASTASAEFFKNLGRKTYITSASYLELIKSFTILTNTKQEELMKARDRYLGGLEKLQHAAASISVMQKQLAELQPQLQTMSTKATEMRVQIEAETISVEKATALVREDEKVANRQAAAAQALKKECEADLAEALPILNDALAALDTLKPADITLVKSMKNPPAAIKMVLAAVCIIKDIKPDRVPDPASGRVVLDYWGPSKKMLGDMNFLQNLKDFDKDNIKTEIIARIRKEFIPNKDFKPELVAKASSAAEGLCKWIIAIDKYDKVWKIVAPKKAKLDAAEKEFAETMATLTAKREEVAKLEEALADLNEQLEVAIQKQTDLQDNVDLCNAKLYRAQKLIGGLGGEKTRWTQAADNLLLKYEGLAGDILISVGIISYLSPFNAQYRQEMVTKWHKFVRDLRIPCCEEFDFISILGLDVVIQNWYIFGLPRDTFSTENGIIMANSRRWSLFIDPQSQASTWIKKMEKKNDLVVVKFSYPSYMKQIELCIQSGAPVLVDGIEETLEAPLDPILYKKVFKQAGLKVISLGENVIEYSDKFRLYMCSKYRNPHYLPEVFNKVTIVNFALTMDGLQDQLLGIVVAVENPDLQQLKEELIVQKAENKAALLRVEENILRTLAESKGDILEDESAIKILDESRTLSVEITEKQEKSLEIEKSIEESRTKYTSVAHHSSVLYYCISDLANIDPMYQYSLEWFINLYISSIQKAEKFRIIERRCQSLINGFTFDLYSNITRSLFEKDKLLFSFLLCAKILIFQGKLEERDLIFLLTGGVGVKNNLENPTNWLPSKSWDEICRVSELPTFRGFLDHFIGSHVAWKKLYDHVEPHTIDFPAPWNNKLNSFMKLIVIRLFRPDKILIAISQFVKSEMGEKFILPPQFNIALSFKESYSLSPLIFILSPGTDPMAALVKFAESMKFTERFQSISLGQGQGPRAAAMIESAQLEGGWICLQNCHLATSWMPTLEKIFEDIDYGNTHEFFRLWLTSYPSDKFPITLLQKGVKMTNEPPTGLQQNLLKSYTSEPVKNSEFFSGCPGKEVMFARILYGTAYFHAVVQERRTFGALGWNIPYGFNDSDFHISVQQVRMFINESENPYEALSYLIGECNYGGRVTDDWDRRLIVTLLEDFLNPEVANDPSYRFVNIPMAYYGLPKDNTYENYIYHINHMPQIHPPEVFGLHTNAGITKDLQNSNILLNSVLKAYGEGSTSGGEDVDKYLMLLTTDILEKLPAVFDLDTAKAKYPVVYNESMNTVLVQEMERFNKLLLVIRASLINLQKVIKGLAAISPAVEAFSTSLMLSRIPSNWMNVSYPSLKNLPDYIADFFKRIVFLKTWFEEGKPRSYWISGFFFTQAFLTGVKQNYARKYTIPIDKLTYDFEVLRDENIINAPVDGAFIYGLYTDGARWSKRHRILDELRPKILNEPMPTIWVKPTRVDDLQVKGRYTCPVYKTSTRKGVLSTTGHSTNYVLPVLIETNESCAHWIKRSVALLCQLD